MEKEKEKEMAARNCETAMLITPPRLILGLLLFGLACFNTQLSIAEINKSTKPIRIIKNDWTSQIVMAQITGGIFTSLNYTVEYSSSTTNQQWGALAQGLDHVQIEVWQGTMSDMFNRMVKAKKIIDAGSHKATTREEWWYPTFVEKMCPGLPDWQALKRCSDLFRTDASGQKGHYFAGPWEKPEAAKIRALGLNFAAIQVKDADELWSALESAVKNQTPVVIFNWTPNWVEARYEGKFIEFPVYDPRCETDPSWGINQQYHYDCGNPKDGWLKKAAWAGMPDTWDCAYRTLQNLSFTNQMIARLAAQVDVDKQTPEVVARQWLTNNEQLWKSWIPANCRI